MKTPKTIVESAVNEMFLQDKTGERVDGWLAVRSSLLWEGKDDGYVSIATPNAIQRFGQEIASRLLSAFEELVPEEKIIGNEVSCQSCDGFRQAGDCDCLGYNAALADFKKNIAAFKETV